MQEKAKDLTFVIASVPDPLHTHFSLSFDRLMEAIQQGATGVVVLAGNART
jgi:hypothetical protein